MINYSTYINDKRFNEILNEGSLIKDIKGMVHWLFGKSKVSKYDDLDTDVINNLKLNYTKINNETDLNSIKKYFNKLNLKISNNKYSKDNNYICYSYVDKTNDMNSDKDDDELKYGLPILFISYSNSTSEKIININEIEIFDQTKNSKDNIKKCFNNFCKKICKKNLQVKTDKYDKNYLENIGFKQDKNNTYIYDYNLKLNEDLNDNFLWKLDKWFERNEIQEKEFIELIIYCNQTSTDIKNIEKKLQGMSLYKNLKEFVNFLNDDFDFTSTKDYIYQLKKIIEIALNNKSYRNKYNNTL